jgi:hypothetical protein
MGAACPVKLAFRVGFPGVSDLITNLLPQVSRGDDLLFDRF